MAAKRRDWDALSPRYRGRLERALRRLGHTNPRQYYESGENLQKARGHVERREHIIRRERKRAGGGGQVPPKLPREARAAVADFEASAPSIVWNQWAPIIRAAESDPVEYDRVASWLQRIRDIALDYRADPTAPKGSWPDYFAVTAEAMEAYPQLKPKAFWYHW